MLDKINWPTAVVALGGLIFFGLVVFFGKDAGLSDELYSEVLAGLGALGAVVLAFMKSAFSKPAAKDEDGK